MIIMAVNSIQRRIKPVKINPKIGNIFFKLGFKLRLMPLEFGKRLSETRSIPKRPDMITILEGQTFKSLEDSLVKFFDPSIHKEVQEEKLWKALSKTRCPILYITEATVEKRDGENNYKFKIVPANNERAFGKIEIEYQSKDE